MARGTYAVVDLAALQHNFGVIRQRVGDSNVLSVVKADAYGHGIERVAAALSGSGSDGFGVAIIDEAIQLRDAGIQQPVVLLEGVTSAGDLAEAANQGLDVVVHTVEQLRFFQATSLPRPVRVWLKFDTGMHRLGIHPTQLPEFYRALKSLDSVSDVILMSHLACADEPNSPFSANQLAKFNTTIETVAAVPAGAGKSLANSAGTFSQTGTHFQWVRPGLALYGGSPLQGVTAESLGLKPVMQLSSTVLATRLVKAGDAVGYGAAWIADRDTPVAIVGIGYGDGYPRHVAAQTPVLIRGVRCPLVGRVSMDMIAVDLSPLKLPAGAIGLGEPVIIWGNGLPVEDVAQAAGTINYELLCQVTGRVKRIYR
ncbi:MAG: alanine racemase [Gammaproteobacteria bacterium]|nr:MAG: alanine racemase [Gammaproteobacteria bacterium]